jgi:hypothetical protein
MGKFNLAPAIDVRLEPIGERFVHHPCPTRTFKSWSCRRFDRKRLGPCVPCKSRPTACVATSLMDKGWGGESVSQSPLVNKAFFGFLDSNPRIPQPSRNEVSLLCPVLHLLRRCVVLVFPKAPGILSCLFAQPRGGIAHVSSTTRDMIIRPPRRRWLPLFWPSRSL